jgi:hypothetical protein
LLASAAATPKTSAVSSSPSTAANITAPKQQQIKAVNNTHINAISRPAGGAAGTTIAPVSHSPPTNTSSSSSSPLAIAPQIRAINQQQPSPSIRGINSTTGFNSTAVAINTTALPPIILINGTTPINSTAGQNYTFAATSPVATSDQLLYLGYHGAQGNSGSKHNDNHDSKPHTRSTRSVSDGSSEHKETKAPKPPRIKIIATDNDSTAKKTTRSTKVDRTDSANDDPKPPKPRSTKTTSDGSSTAKKTATISTKLDRSDTPVIIAIRKIRLRSLIVGLKQRRRLRLAKKMFLQRPMTIAIQKIRAVLILSHLVIMPQIVVLA